MTNTTTNPAPTLTNCYVGRIIGEGVRAHFVAETGAWGLVGDAIDYARKRPNTAELIVRVVDVRTRTEMFLRAA